MPVYMDVHEVGPDVTAADIAKAHARDVEVQGKYGVSYDKYYFNEKEGKIFCLCHAPNAEAAIQVHREAHGLEAEKVIQVAPELADLFMGGSEVNPAGAAMLPGVEADKRDPGIRTILFTDIVESTAMTHRMGDEAAMEFLAVHDKIVRDSLASLGGREVKHTGDGIMASFVSAASAVKCATRVQRDVADHARENKERAIKLRIGVAAGEPVEHHNDLFGCTVQLAARLCSQAQPEQILVSTAVAELCVGKTLPFQDVGEVTLKGFENPIRVHAVRWSDEVAA
jgi:class 3 adenylate cyclase